MAKIVAALGDDYVMWGVVDASSPSIGIKLNLESRERGHIGHFGFSQDARHGAYSWGEVAARGYRELVEKARLTAAPLVVTGIATGLVTIDGVRYQLDRGRLQLNGLAVGSHEVVIQPAGGSPIRVDVTLEVGAGVLVTLRPPG